MLLNWPMIVWVLLMCGGGVAAAWNLREGLAVLRGLHPPSTSNQGMAFALTIAFALTALAFSHWVIRVQRPERAVIRSALSDIDEIDVVLRRREW